MMRILYPHLQNPERKALFISLLCHIAFAKLFLIAFSVTPSEFKPTLIFAGAILTENDFRNLVAKAPSSAEQMLPAIAIKNNSDSVGAATVLSKPIFGNADFRKQKTFLKSSFIKTPEQRPANDNENFGIELSVPQRVPLKLNLK